jgi:hypothetical protein
VDRVVLRQSILLETREGNGDSANEYEIPRNESAKYKERWEVSLPAGNSLSHSVESLDERGRRKGRDAKTQLFKLKAEFLRNRKHFILKCEAIF